MTEFELLGRIADLETALRLVVVAWIITVVVLRNMPTDQLFWAEAIGRPCHLIRPSDWDSGRVGELLR